MKDAHPQARADAKPQQPDSGAEGSAPVPPLGLPGFVSATRRDHGSGDPRDPAQPCPLPSIPTVRLVGTRRAGCWSQGCSPTRDLGADTRQGGTVPSQGTHVPPHLPKMKPG